ncbi:hypothetical protein BX666DRAFT_1854267 [Dichotomocladium elegans]|nr:hypothetical protein BX666DRAFT_1854267 [Dichotomocladium elegans]
MSETFIHPCSQVNIHDHHGTLLTSSLHPSSWINEWIERTPHAMATLTLYDGDTFDVPVYALRRRNAVVENLPDAPPPYFLVSDQ